MKLLIATVVAGVVLSAHPAWAHVTVVPRESRPGVSERYTVRVPTEGKVSTVEVELEIPEGMTISPQAPVGWTHTLKRTGDRVTSIVWAMEIKPGEFAEFGFFGRNPKTGTAIAWKAHQRFADGTATHWVGEPGTRSPASVTTLVAAAAQDEFAAVAHRPGTYDRHRHLGPELKAFQNERTWPVVLFSTPLDTEITACAGEGDGAAGTHGAVTALVVRPS